MSRTTKTFKVKAGKAKIATVGDYCDKEPLTHASTFTNFPTNFYRHCRVCS